MIKMPEKKQYNKKTTTPENVSDEKVVEEFVVFKPYKVKIAINNLNVRDGGSINANVIGTAKPGITTIVEENENSKWGKMKDGGWICLEYVDRL